MDPLYVSSVLKKFGKTAHLKSFPHMSFLKLQYYIWIKRIREVRLMEFIDYRKKDVDVILEKELDWQYYGGHHHENVFTKFFQSYYLPTRFNIDKRKTELSAMIRSKQITREEALAEIAAASYQYDENVVKYALNKLCISDNEWQSIMKSQIKSHDDYATYLPMIRMLKLPIKIAVKLKVLPSILYLKYAK